MFKKFAEIVQLFVTCIVNVLIYQLNVPTVLVFTALETSIAKPIFYLQKIILPIHSIQIFPIPMGMFSLTNPRMSSIPAISSTIDIYQLNVNKWNTIYKNLLNDINLA